MARISINTEELRQQANHQRELAARIDGLGRRLGAALSEVPLSPANPELAAARLEPRIQELLHEIASLKADFSSVADEMARSADQAELAEADEFGLESIGQFFLNHLVPTDFPSAPTFLLADLMPRFDGITPGSALASVVGPLNPSRLEVLDPRHWSLTGQSGEAVRLIDSLGRGSRPAESPPATFVDYPDLPNSTMKVWGSDRERTK